MVSQIGFTCSSAAWLHFKLIAQVIKRCSGYVDASAKFAQTTKQIKAQIEQDKILLQEMKDEIETRMTKMDFPRKW